jgi:predicted permease
MHVAIPRSRYPRDIDVAAYCKRIVDAVSAIRGVESAGMVNRLPLSSTVQTLPVEFDSGGDSVQIDSRVVTSEYFQAMAIPVVAGRTFTEADTETSRPVGMIDRQLATRVWPNESPVGKRFRIAVKGFDMPWTEIIGVVGHVRNDGMDVDTRPQVYWSYLQRTQDRMVLAVRTMGEPEAMTASIVRTIRSVDAEQPVYDVQTMSQWRDRSLRQRRLTSGLISAFGLAALFLAGIGVYGLVSFVAGMRKREFAIRLALGASANGIQRLLLGHAFRLTIAGIVAGAVIAAPLVVFIRSLLYDVKPTDEVVLAAAPITALAVAILASIGPALRARRTDPAVVLRDS